MSVLLDTLVLVVWTLSVTRHVSMETVPPPTTVHAKRNMLARLVMSVSRDMKETTAALLSVIQPV